MSSATTDSTTIELRRSGLLGLLGTIAVVAALSTWAVLAAVEADGARTPANAPEAAAASALSWEVVAPAFGSGFDDVARRLYAEGVAGLTSEVVVNRPGFDGGSAYWVPTVSWSVCWAA
jgi:tripartite-type tricarboxylate transporter receptor subunit TctC